MYTITQPNNVFYYPTFKRVLNCNLYLKQYRKVRFSSEVYSSISNFKYYLYTFFMGYDTTVFYSTTFQHHIKMPDSYTFTTNNNTYVQYKI